MWKRSEMGFSVDDVVNGGKMLFKTIEEAEAKVKENPLKYELIEDYSCYDKHL